MYNVRLMGGKNYIRSTARRYLHHLTMLSNHFLLCGHFPSISDLLLRLLRSSRWSEMVVFSARQRLQRTLPGLQGVALATIDHLMEQGLPSLSSCHAQVERDVACWYLSFVSEERCPLNRVLKLEPVEPWQNLWSFASLVVIYIYIGLLYKLRN